MAMKSAPERVEFTEPSADGRGRQNGRQSYEAPQMVSISEERLLGELAPVHGVVSPNFEFGNFE
jgi:hypothetical protein